MSDTQDVRYPRTWPAEQVLRGSPLVVFGAFHKYSAYPERAQASAAHCAALDWRLCTKEG